MKLIFLAFLSSCICSSFIANAKGIDFDVDTDRSAFAAITHKTGIMAAFAHNHIINVAEVSSRIILSEEGSINHMKVEFSVADLIVDDPVFRDKWYASLIDKYKILNEKPKDLGGSDRKKIRDGMLADDQLDATKYKTIFAQISDVETKERDTKFGKFSHRVKMMLIIHGKSQYKLCDANISADKKSFVGDFICEIRFSDFGIEPVSMFLGAVGNEDIFHIAAHIEASATQ